jgi:pimeloyl-ACP methyl ester carboxylesterase
MVSDMRAQRSTLRARYYLGDAFIIEHSPPGDRCRATGILLLPPFGYEDISAYRPLSLLADALADAGHLVLRLDWPGQGDSALDHDHPELVQRQVAAAKGAAASLRARGFPLVAGIGVSAGGLLALAAEGLDEVVLWGAPVSGRAFLRAEQAFHRMAARAFGEPAGEIPPLPEGAVEAGGFLYSPETAAALRGLAPAAGPLRRALVLPRDGTAPPPKLLKQLTDRGAAISEGPASGVGDLMEDPYRAALSPEVREAVLGWLTDTERISPAAHPGEDRLALPGGISERPWTLRGEAGELSGIVCEPPGGAAPGASWTLFLNAGGVRRCGPNRLWTRGARALARDGHPSLRFDVRDVGDSAGVTVPHKDLEAMHSEGPISDAVLAADWLKEQGASSVDVVGLCSGSYLGMQLSARREVRRALLINGLVFVWDDDARASSMTSHILVSLLDARRWRRLLTGKIDARALARSVVSRGRLSTMTLYDRARGRPPLNEVERLVRRITARGTDLRLISSAGDPSIKYLERNVDGAYRPKLVIIQGVDHTLRPVWSHPVVVEWIREMNSGRPFK